MRALFLALCLPLAATAAPATWLPITWQYGSVAPGQPRERLALMLDAKLDGVACKVQLDTGANGAVLWHGDSGHDAPRRMIPVEVGGVRSEAGASEAIIASLRTGSCEGLASLGNAFFDRGTLTLDLARDRYRYDEAALLASQREAQPLIYAQWYGSGGHLLVELRLPGGAVDYAMLDTGAARFGVSALDAQGWSRLTGGLPAAEGPGVATFQVNSWGKQIPCYETEVAAPVGIGNMLEVPQMQASYCVLDAFKPGQKLAGLLGLRHLNGHVITLDYLSRRWLLR
ncbi:hypothetical protein ACLB1G_20985 [Oxalobacteraceae bacterium A2-2]